MLPMHPNEFVAMQATHTDAMRDQCVLMEPQTSAGRRYNKSTTSYADAGSSVCGFNPSTANGVASDEVLDSTAFVLTKPTLRLPIDTVIAAPWRVRITHRDGQALTEPLMFDVVGDPATIGTAIVVELATTTREEV